MKFDIHVGNWSQMRADARAVRTEVFLVEQNIPIELEWDDMDAASIHAVAYDESGAPIATGRLLPDGHIGRMAVSRPLRGQGVGAAILGALIRAAQERGEREVMLNAQIQAEAFYTRFGFSREGEEFPDAGIPHIHMRRRVG